MGALSPVHWLILIVVIVVLFGAKRLPDASRSIGRSLRIFKSEMKDMGEDGKKVDTEKAAAPQPPAAAPAPQQLPAAPAETPAPTADPTSATTPQPAANPAQHVQAERIEKAS